MTEEQVRLQREVALDTIPATVRLRTEISYRSGGHQTVLTVRGEHGAAQATFWKFQGDTIGVIGFHSRTPRSYGQQQQTCPVLGFCYDASCTFVGGQDVGQLYEKGDHEGAFAELESWYRSVFAEEMP